VTESLDGFVEVGYVSRAHGVKGSVIVRVIGDEAGQFTPDRLLGTDRPTLPGLTVLAAHPHKDGLLVTFAEITDRNRAEELKGTLLLIGAAERRTLDDDEYWPDQLIGLAVVTGDGLRVGEVTDVITGPQDRLVVSTHDGDREVPFVRAIVTDVELGSGFVVIDPPDGLL
jgi:16S rRNA processing protein RimM